MKAIVQDRYGSLEVLRLTDIDPPVAKDDEVLLRVRAAAVNPADWLTMRGKPLPLRLVSGLLRPKEKIRGTDVAGQVEAVGKDVTRWKPGDEVFGWCEGAFAEKVCAAEGNFVSKPKDLTFEQAASVTMAGLTALHAMRDHGKVQPGQKVLINGASGGIGTFAVQIAKAYGADVTGVCSTGNVELVRSLGSDQVIDYTREDFTRSGQRYDLILDTAGNRSLSDLRRALTPRGTFLSNSDKGFLRRMIGMLVLSPFVRQRLRTFLMMPKHEDLVAMKELIETGKVTPVVGKTYPLSEAVEAMGHLGGGHARGKVVVIE